LWEAVDVALANGTLDLEDLIGDLKASVASGTVAGNLVLVPGGICNIGLSNGIVDIAIPTSSSAEF
jgi:hypothetical protein